MSANAEKQLTGRKVLMITLAAFTVIIGANMALLFAALGSFPGLEVKNSYVASQSFDRERAAQAALGWSAGAERRGGQLHVVLRDGEGRVIYPQAIHGRIGRATHVREDRTLTLRRSDTGYVSDIALDPGAWTIWLEARAEDGSPFRQRLSLYVRPQE